MQIKHLKHTYCKLLSAQLSDFSGVDRISTFALVQDLLIYLRSDQVERVAETIIFRRPRITVGLKSLSLIRKCTLYWQNWFVNYCFMWLESQHEVDNTYMNFLTLKHESGGSLQVSFLRHISKTHFLSFTWITSFSSTPWSKQKMFECNFSFLKFSITRPRSLTSIYPPKISG